MREEGRDHDLHPESLAIVCLPKTVPSSMVEAATPAGPWDTFPARSHVVSDVVGRGEMLAACGFLAGLTCDSLRVLACRST